MGLLRAGVEDGLLLYLGWIVVVGLVGVRVGSPPGAVWAGQRLRHIGCRHPKRPGIREEDEGGLTLALLSRSRQSTRAGRSPSVRY